MLWKNILSRFKKSEMTKKIIDLPIWGMAIHVFKVKNMEKCKQCEELGIIPGVLGYTMTENNQDIFVYFFINESGFSPGILAHEALHIVNLINKRIQRKNNEIYDDDEFEAYLIHYLTDEFFSFLYHKRKVKNV